MARYLRQLAEQAIRPATALRSAAAAAFAPEPMIPGDEADTIIVSGRKDGGPRAPDAAAPATHSPHTTAGLPDSGPAPPDAGRARDPIAAAAAASGKDGSLAHEPGPAAAAVRPAARPVRGRSTPTVPGKRAAAAQTTEPPMRDERSARPPLQPASPAAGAMLTPAPHPARGAQARPTSPRTRADSGAAPAPDIHIHIGRIELTAATPAAPAKRTAAPGARPMTLDAYLRQRGRKAP